MNCRTCDKELSGRRKAFCSEKCRQKNSNRIHQGYEAQQARAKKRKREFVELKGGGCEVCGYNSCLDALEFHHRDPSQKEFRLDSRSLSNRTLQSCLDELEKCDLLCANHHRERHVSMRER